MSVKVRRYRGGPDLEVDVRVEMENGFVKRVRRRFKNGHSQNQALHWGERVQRAIIAGKHRSVAVVVPHRPAKTVAEFVPYYLDVYCPGRKDKPSFIHSKRAFLRRHIIPALGDKPLNELSAADIIKLNTRIAHMKRGSANNHLAAFSSLLKAAVEAGEISAVPVPIHMHKVPAEACFESYSLEEYQRLVDAARARGVRTLVAILLGGDAGLRRGEVLALKWSDLDLEREHPHVIVSRTAWRDQDFTPKNGDPRKVPLTQRLVAALVEYRRWTRERLVQEVLELSGFVDGAPITPDEYRIAERCLFANSHGCRMSPDAVTHWVKQAQRAARLARATGKFHILRHTFCSHLAARGVPAIDIKALAGHRSIRTTEKYMHNLPGAAERGIAKLERPGDDVGSAPEHRTAETPRDT